MIQHPLGNSYVCISWTSLAALLLSGSLSFALFSVPPETPVDRIVENARSYVENNPDDPRGYYVLGRIYSIAFAQQSDTLDMFSMRGDGPPRFASPAVRGKYAPSISGKRPEWLRVYLKNLTIGRPDEKNDDGEGENGRKTEQLSGEKTKKATWKTIAVPLVPSMPEDVEDDLLEKMKKPGKMKLLRRLHRALYYHVKAIRTAGEKPDPKFYLGLAWSLEVASRPSLAAKVYHRAFRAGLERGKTEGAHLHGFWHGSVALEAGQRLLHLLDEEVVDSSVRNSIDRNELNTSVKKLESKIKVKGITPVIVPLTERKGYNQLVDDGTCVKFDLDGDGTPRRWSWVSPDAGLLVWDPTGHGRIKSGRQLFGSVTWWIIWPHGYRPLKMLDDDADGWLSGDELNGLSIWRDRNQNGTSDHGEVRPVTEWGIRELSVRTDGYFQENSVPFSKNGAVFENGDVRPTYDWVAKPAEQASTAQTE